MSANMETRDLARTIRIQNGIADATPEVAKREKPTTGLDLFVKDADESVYLAHPEVADLWAAVQEAITVAKAQTTVEDMKQEVLDSAVITVSQEGKAVELSVRQAYKRVALLIRTDSDLQKEKDPKTNLPKLTLAMGAPELWEELQSIKFQLKSLGLDTSHGAYGIWGALEVL